MSSMAMFHHLKCTCLYYRLDANSSAAKTVNPRVPEPVPKSAAVSKTEQQELIPFTIIG